MRSWRSPARDRLYLTDAAGFSEGAGFRYPSRFIFDVDKPLLRYEAELPDDIIKIWADNGFGLDAWNEFNPNVTFAWGPESDT